MVVTIESGSQLDGLSKEGDGKARCTWGCSSEIYRAYHDEEWGFPVSDDRRLFEKICLEGFQAGLSWITILKKRENFRTAFANFDLEPLASFGKRDVNRLLKDTGIVRNRMKIEATINNAARAIELIESEGSLSSYFWGFEPGRDERPEDFSWKSLSKITQTPLSKALSKDLKKRGWKFVGPTTAYAFMQAMGLVNDHVEGCFVRKAALKERKKFQP